MKNIGIHIIGDLYQCNLKNLAKTENKLKQLIKAAEKKIRESGLNNLGSVHYFFGPNAVTATIILAESHVAFHTWPEINFTSLDVFVCNFTKNNAQCAAHLFSDLAKNIFKSEKIVKKIIKH